MDIMMTKCSKHTTTLQKEVDADLLQKFWSGLRCEGPDIYNVIKYDGVAVTQVDKGWMPRGTERNSDLRELVKQAERLEKCLTSNIRKVSIERECDFVKLSLKSDDTYMVFCKCSEGIIGVGWRLKSGNLNKAEMLAAFTLYSIGLLHPKEDEMLWNISYRHLPFELKFDRSQADKILADYFKKLVVC